MKSARFLIAAASLGFAVCSLGFVAGPEDIDRIGSGSHRTELNAMELKPFDSALWAELSGWTNGSALSAGATDGKPVVLFTWRSWHKVSHTALPLAQKLADTFGKDGLIVLGVHDARGNDKAAEVAAANNAKFLMAHDANGKFAAGIKADHAPAYYVIDRAGNVRFADISKESLDKAVALVVKETKEQAAAVPGDKLAAAAKAEAEARKGKAVAENYNPNAVLDVPFTMPDPSAYDAVKWPEQAKQVEYANNVQGKALPAAFGSETWITEKPNSNGRVVVVDFWATWCGPCKKAMPKLDDMQKSNRQDLTIIGLSDEDTTKVRTFLSSNKHVYAQAADKTAVVKKALNITAIPHVVVMSTDGVVRWQGNPHDPNFRSTVEQIIRVDPGVAARRKAEEAFQKRQNG